MISNDIITCMNNFTNNNNLRLLNKEISRQIDLVEKSEEWYLIYSKYFTKNNIKIPKLNYKSCMYYNWKKENNRIQNYEIGATVNIDSSINDENLWLSGRLVKEIPKEIVSLIHLRRLWLNNNKIKEIPIEICNLVNLRTICLGNNLIKEIRLSQALPAVLARRNRKFDEFRIFMVL